MTTEKSKRKYEKKPTRTIHEITVAKVMRFQLVVEDEKECSVYFSMLRTKGAQKGTYTRGLYEYWYPYQGDEPAIEHFKKYVKNNHEVWMSRIAKPVKNKATV